MKNTLDFIFLLFLRRTSKQATHPRVCCDHNKNKEENDDYCDLLGLVAGRQDHYYQPAKESSKSVGFVERCASWLVKS